MMRHGSNHGRRLRAVTSTTLTPHHTRSPLPDLVPVVGWTGCHTSPATPTPAEPQVRKWMRLCVSGRAAAAAAHTPETARRCSPTRRLPRHVAAKPSASLVNPAGAGASRNAAVRCGDALVTDQRNQRTCSIYSGRRRRSRSSRRAGCRTGRRSA